MKFTLIGSDRFESDKVRSWIENLSQQGTISHGLLLSFGKESCRFLDLLLNSNYTEIESKPVEFRGGRKSKTVGPSTSTPVAQLEFHRLQPASPITTCTVTVAIATQVCLLDDLSHLSSFKKQIIEPILSLISSDDVSHVCITAPSPTVAALIALILSCTHPSIQYTTDNSSIQLKIQPVDGYDFSVDFPDDSSATSSCAELLTGTTLESTIQQCIQTALSQLNLPAESMSETSLFFLRKIIFAIVKERKQKKSIQSFQKEILAQLKDTEDPNMSRKRKHELSEESKESTEQLNPSKSMKIRSVKPLPTLEQGLSVFEFFSGIGGMRLALPKVIGGIHVKQITAFDINRIANQVYEYNFHETKIDDIPHSQLKTFVIEALKPEDVDGKCDIWTMSPPCQPFTTTRGASRKDHLDNRSKGLYHIMSLLLTIKHLPRWIVLENVKGFVNSEMYFLWLQVIRSCGYDYEEYLLSPDTAVGIPNARKRYYFIAEWKELKEGSRNLTESGREALAAFEDYMNGNEKISSVDNTGNNKKEEGTTNNDGDSDNEVDERNVKFDEMNGETYEGEEEANLKPETKDSNNIRITLPEHIQQMFSLTSSGEAISIEDVIHRRLSPEDESRFNSLSELFVPPNILQASLAKKHLSIVDLQSRLTYCFTKGYGKIYDHSAGSCLLIPPSSAIVPSKEEEGIPSLASEVNREELIKYYQRIRLFHPEELLVLFGFPNEYSFPRVTESLTLNHQYGCIGNSVNVTVVKAIMQRLFE